MNALSVSYSVLEDVCFCISCVCVSFKVNLIRANPVVRVLKLKCSMILDTEQSSKKIRTNLSAITLPCEWTTSSVGLLTSLKILAPGLVKVQSGERLMSPSLPMVSLLPCRRSALLSISTKNIFPEREL